MKMRGNLFLIMWVLMHLALSLNAQTNIDCPDIKINNHQVYFTSQLHDTKIYDYRIQSDSNISLYRKVKRDSTPESLILGMFEKDLINGGKILFNRKFEFERRAMKYCIIKFDIIDKQKKVKTFIKQLVLSNNIWRFEENNVNKEIIYVIDVLNVKTFWNFYAKDFDSKYAEINALKSDAKDEDVLNIFKLYDVLKKHNRQLSKYLESESY
jgi:hypothetical protein